MLFYTINIGNSVSLNSNSIYSTNSYIRNNIKIEDVTLFFSNLGNGNFDKCQDISLNIAIDVNKGNMNMINKDYIDELLYNINNIMLTNNIFIASEDIIKKSTDEIEQEFGNDDNYNDIKFEKIRLNILRNVIENEKIYETDILKFINNMNIYCSESDSKLYNESKLVDDSNLSIPSSNLFETNKLFEIDDNEKLLGLSGASHVSLLKHCFVNEDANLFPILGDWDNYSAVYDYINKIKNYNSFSGCKYLFKVLAMDTSLSSISNAVSPILNKMYEKNLIISKNMNIINHVDLSISSSSALDFFNRLNYIARTSIGEALIILIDQPNKIEGVKYEERESQFKYEFKEDYKSEEDEEDENEKDKIKRDKNAYVKVDKEFMPIRPLSDYSKINGIIETGENWNRTLRNFVVDWQRYVQLIFVYTDTDAYDTNFLIGKNIVNNTSNKPEDLANIKIFEPFPTIPLSNNIVRTQSDLLTQYIRLLRFSNVLLERRYNKSIYKQIKILSDIKNFNTEESNMTIKKYVDEKSEDSKLFDIVDTAIIESLNMLCEKYKIGYEKSNIPIRELSEDSLSKIKPFFSIAEFQCFILKNLDALHKFEISGSKGIILDKKVKQNIEKIDDIDYDKAMRENFMAKYVKNKANQYDSSSKEKSDYGYDGDMTSTKEELQEKYKNDVFYKMSLDDMIGLSTIKDTIKGFVATEVINKMRHKGMGLSEINTSKHMVFMGNPGTAKTTVARKLASILSSKGIIGTNEVVVTSANDLVGKYVGWTTDKTLKTIKSAEGKILLVDEAYMLANDNAGGYNKEAVDTFVAYMDDPKVRDSTIIIFAGYKKEMESFINTNPGLRSRIGYTLDFPNYTIDELVEILKLLTSKLDLKVTDEFIEEFKRVTSQFLNREDFGNGRFVRSLIERSVTKMSVRLTNDKNFMKLCSNLEGTPKNQLPKNILDKICTLEAEDISVKGISTKNTRTKIGFGENSNKIDDKYVK